MRPPEPRIFEPGYYHRLRDIERRHWWSRGLRRAMRALLRRAVGTRGVGRLLDVGCGTGYLLEVVRAWGLAGQAVGVDVSLHALALSRSEEGRGATTARAASAAAPAAVELAGPPAVGPPRGAGLAAASAPELPFAAESFDLVLCVDTLQHLSPAGADRRLLAEIARLLRPEGVLCLRTNSALGHRRLRGADPDLYRRYRRRELAEMAAAAGLAVERATYLNCLPSLPGMLKELFRPSAGRSPASGPTLSIQMPPRSRAGTGEVLHAVLAVEAWWVGRGLDLPFGHSLALVARKPAGPPATPERRTSSAGDRSRAPDLAQGRAGSDGRRVRGSSSGGTAPRRASRPR